MLESGHCQLMSNGHSGLCVCRGGAAVCHSGQLSKNKCVPRVHASTCKT